MQMNYNFKACLSKFVYCVSCREPVVPILSTVHVQHNVTLCFEEPKLHVFVNPVLISAYIITFNMHSSVQISQVISFFSSLI